MNRLLHCQQEQPEFNLENVAKACLAARGLYQWLKAIEEYFFIYELSKPKRDALFLAEKQVDIHKAEIEVRKLHLKEL